MHFAPLNIMFCNGVYCFFQHGFLLLLFFIQYIPNIYHEIFKFLNMYK